MKPAENMPVRSERSRQPARSLSCELWNTAGNDSGGFFWGSYPDRVPGLASSHAQTFGRLAGKNAAKNQFILEALLD